MDIQVHGDVRKCLYLVAVVNDRLVTIFYMDVAPSSIRQWISAPCLYVDSLETEDKIEQAVFLREWTENWKLTDAEMTNTLYVAKNDRR